jgi:hypothetical protein
MRLNFLLLIFICSILETSVQAQNWSWARAATASPGLTSATAGTGITWGFDQASDKSGNVYFLSRGGSNFLIDGHTLTGYSDADVLISSFTCDGVYRWSKIIGTSSDSDNAYSLKTDGRGGVYAIAEMHLSGAHNIDADTVIGATTQTMYLVKWDTAGKFQWLRMPQPTSINYGDASWGSQLIDMDVDEQGNVHVLAYLAPATYSGSYVVGTAGMHILRYAANGQFLGGLPIPITFTLSRVLYQLREIRLAYLPGSNRYVIRGYSSTVLGGLSVGGTAVPSGSNFLTSINSTSGAVGWLKYGNNILVTISNRPCADSIGNIYICGFAQTNPTVGSTVFNGVTLNRGPFAMKLDVAGLPLWTISGQESNKSSSKPASQAFAIGVDGSRVLIGGQFVDTVTFTSHQLRSNYSVDSTDAFLLQVDAVSGTIQRAEKLSGGNGPVINLITAGTKNNFYVGGNIGSAAIVVGGSTVQKPAAHSGLFIAKWGYNNCQCVVPSPGFTSTTLSGTNIRYNYTGTVGGIDSLVWEWGDGSRQKVTSNFTTPITHTFTKSGKYNVCVTAYNDTCGNARFCGQSALSIESQSRQKAATVCPNPAVDKLTIEGADGAKVIIINSIGQEMSSVTIRAEKECVDVANLPTDVYLMRIQFASGQVQNLRFIKK